MNENTRETIGCDLGDKYSEIVALNAAGKRQPPVRLATTRPAMRAFFTRPAAHVIIEVGTHSRWISELLKERGHEVTIANPRRVKLISASDSKTDRADAELLARLGRADLQLLAPVTHRKNEAQADLAVAKSRDELVRTRTRLVNHARGLVKSFGLRLPKCTSEAFVTKARSEVPKELKPALEPILTALEGIGVQIKALDKTIERVAKKYPDVAIINQVNGVGTLIALVFLLTLDDKTRFKKSRQVGAFLGLRPRKDQSGDSDKQLRITKSGDPFVRRLLVNAAAYILGPFGKDSDLRRWGLELGKRGGRNAKKRARVAVARKLGVVMHRLWTTGEVYKPLRTPSTQPSAAA
jgi:transposase